MSEQPEATEHPVVVVGPDGRPMQLAAGAQPEVGADEGDAGESDLGDPTAQIEQPAKVMRIGTMVKQLLEEVRAAPLDHASRGRLKDIYETSVHELESGLAPELRDELRRLSLPFVENATPTNDELRVAQAQLVGWLEGVFHGIQTALFAQQMAARAQLDQMRKALPPGTMIHGEMPPGAMSGHQLPGMPGGPEQGGPTGQYL